MLTDYSATLGGGEVKRKEKKMTMLLIFHDIKGKHSHRCFHVADENFSPVCLVLLRDKRFAGTTPCHL